MKKKIFLQYYSQLNFGDDMFVKLFAKYFSDYKILLLCNPLYIPKDLEPNIHISFFSYNTAILGKLHRYIKNRLLQQKIQRLYDRCVTHAEKRAVASVRIGGSIFQDMPNGQEEICFDAPHSETLDFSFHSTVFSERKNFIIGANLGPAYNEDYFSKMEKLSKTYAHMCLRDYASFRMMKNCPNVQYAPDVVFLMNPIRRIPTKKRVIISVIDVSRKTKNQQITEKYYSLLADTAAYLIEQGNKIALVSFCQHEGDENGIENLLRVCKYRNSVEVIKYQGNTSEIIDCFADASYVIASRFHSMILAAVCGKPMFPISYNCKTKHYLQDIKFTGSYASLDELPDYTVSDILRNYEESYVCDCSKHHQYAVNQFMALKDFLEKK